MDLDLEQSEATVERIAAGLHPSGLSGRGGFTWGDYLKKYRYSGTGALGEIRSVEDLDAMPADVPVRVVYLVDKVGPVIRWVASEKLDKQVKRIIFHHDMFSGEDYDCEDIRSGYLVRCRDRRIKVIG